ncbi:cysteine hydrolase family protein [Acinetobacter sp. ANC 5383]
MKKIALLVIDVQNDYFPKGKIPLSQPEQALQNIHLLEKAFHQVQVPIIYIQHVATAAEAPFFVAGTEGVKLYADLDVDAESIIIQKHFPNSFFQTGLKAQLQQLEIEQLLVTGMMTHMCVDATTRAAAEYGYDPIVIADATATKDLQYAGRIVSAQDVQTAYLSAFQMFAQIQTTEKYLSHATRLK